MLSTIIYRRAQRNALTYKFAQLFSQLCNVNSYLILFSVIQFVVSFSKRVYFGCIITNSVELTYVCVFLIKRVHVSASFNQNVCRFLRQTDVFYELKIPTRESHPEPMA